MLSANGSERADLIFDPSLAPARADHNQGHGAPRRAHSTLAWRVLEMQICRALRSRYNTGTLQRRFGHSATIPTTDAEEPAEGES